MEKKRSAREIHIGEKKGKRKQEIKLMYLLGVNLENRELRFQHINVFSTCRSKRTRSNDEWRRSKGKGSSRS